MTADPRGADRAAPIGISVLNWNNAEDTIRCIQSLAGLDDRSFFVILVDNASSDASWPTLIEVLPTTWTAGSVTLQDLQAPDGGASVGADIAVGEVRLIRTRANLGYAGGNNVAIRAAIAAGCEAVWILNNDTAVDAPALGHLRESLRRDPDAGAIGALILDADGDRVQCLGGGRYSWWRGSSRLVGGELTATDAATADTPCCLDYISGASMLIPSSTLAQVGPLDERYFLYCEEVDYAERCRAAGRHLAVSRAAIVHHRLGATIGSSRTVASRSNLAAYHASRSALLLVRRHRPWFVPTALAARIAFAAWLGIRGSRGLAAATIAGSMHGLVDRTPGR